MNKLSFIKSGLVVLAALVLASCSKTAEFQHNPDSALEIESVSGISPFALTTKAVITGESLPGEEATKGIGLFVTAEDGSAYDGHDSGYSNVKYTYNGSKWNTTTPIYLSGSVGNLYGYFPYNPDATDLRAIPVASSLNGTDYLYANIEEVSHSDKTVNLHMKHALSRLHLTIKKGKNFTAEATLSEITLKSTAIDATGTMDLTTGAITPAKLPAETGKVDLTTEGEITVEGIEKDILLVPADNSAGKKDIAIFLLIDGKSAGITLSGENGIGIRSGIQNNVILTIEDTGIKVSGVDVGVWNDQGSQEVQVGAFTVTVKLSDDAGIAENLYTQIFVGDNYITIGAYSKEVKPLVIRTGDGSLIAPVEDGNFSTFTISGITSNITATLAYAKTRTVSVNVAGVDKEPNVSGYVYGKAEPITVLEGRPATLTATPGGGYDVDYFDINGTIASGNMATAVIPYNVDAIDVYFRYSDMLDGVFTVADDGKGNVRKVRFSRGNFWYGGQYTFNIESNQYDSTPTNSDDDRDNNHISHFLWCEDVFSSLRELYDNFESSSPGTFFTNADGNKPNPNFTVNGQNEFWRILSGGNNGEWEYLMNRKDKNDKVLYKCGIKVCDHTNCLILLPDDWEWDANTVGTGWQTEYSESTDVKWSTMEAAGAVCLPAAGARWPKFDGIDAYQILAVIYIGDDGQYWSSTPYVDDAYCLSFNSGGVNTSGYDRMHYAFSVRLVTDVQ